MTTALATRPARRRRRRRGLPRCKFCGQPVLWCSTTSGKSMPVDPKPNRAGTVLLASQPGAPGARPLAIALHTEHERITAPAESIHTSHMKTCPALDSASN